MSTAINAVALILMIYYSFFANLCVFNVYFWKFCVIFLCGHFLSVFGNFVPIFKCFVSVCEYFVSEFGQFIMFLVILCMSFVIFCLFVDAC